MKNKVPAVTPAKNTTVDLLIIGSGTGMAAALSAHERGLSTLIIEKTPYIGGSTARSGGAFWIPGNAALPETGPRATADASTYLNAVVGTSAPPERGTAYLKHGAAAVDMLRRTTPMRFFWAKGYSDYHPEKPGGRPEGRTCECRPFNASVLGPERPRLRPGVMEAPVPMPVTGADYKWMNLLARKPLKALPRILARAALGIGGMLIGRDYLAGGQALAAGMFAGVLRAGIPVWTETSLIRLLQDNDRVTGAVLRQGDKEVTVQARRGVVLAAGGFDHDVEARHKFQSPRLGEHASLGSEGNTGDAILAGQELGAGTALMDQAWWFPAFAPVPGGAPAVMLAERSLPGSFIVDQNGKRFINEAIDYMSFGQEILARERAGTPVEEMWLVFDQRYRDSYIMAGRCFPRQPLPESWYRAGIAHKSEDLGTLAAAMGVPATAFEKTFQQFNAQATAGADPDFGRGDSAYDRYYGDPTIGPNPNLAPLRRAPYYAVKVVLSDLGTCGGLVADEHARVLREDGDVVDGLYAIGNTAANAFGTSYPGAGATIGQGVVYGYIAAMHAAGASS
ncbi:MULTISPECIES: 3-ketosteroid-delta-1-dehydrogenase [Amycolatopsis]|uniref:3-ketosteroid-delta-1-dehydrogenase n=1 Tax=Amycolatopsis albidoflavus TaxID=102226 RepID=A0ABW5I976_9PSEU